jgi:cation diffusion facilitator CzcD-associated flavoprotein CzcO
VSPDLDALAARARRELAMLAYPARPWVRPMTHASGANVYDVAIVGAGQSGMAAALALRREGVTNVVLLDRSPAGLEGPWETYARMQELRTPKISVGLETGIPSLSAQAWYEATYGAAAWGAIQRVPRRDWMAYLRWYRSVVDLPIRNDVGVEDIAPLPGMLALATRSPAGTATVLARRVILATGFDGNGRWSIPEQIERAVPPDRLAHSNTAFDLARLAGKRVGILGHGASAFDLASAALDAGAVSVDLCYRRTDIPTVNPHRWLEYPGLLAHYPELPDPVRWEIAHHFDTVDQPPTQRSFDEAHARRGFRRHPASPWLAIGMDGDAVRVRTPHAAFTFDFIVASTGSMPDLGARPELGSLASHVALWSDRYTPPPALAHPLLGRFPYLGEDYRLLPLDAAQADAVERVHAYSFAAYVSQGPHSTSVSGHKYSLPRLVRGITRALLREQTETLLGDLRAYADPELVIPTAAEARRATG